jgi:hypothetical protein
LLVPGPESQCNTNPKLKEITMSNTQTLNLYLDLSQSHGSQDGLFADNATGRPSKVWLNGANPPVQTPDHALSVSFAATVATSLQVTINLPSGWSFVDVNGYCLRVTSVFGRDHNRGGSSAVYASPFTIGDVVPTNGQPVCTVFDNTYTAAQVAQNPSNPVSNPVAQAFGTPRLSSGFPNNGTDKYAFIVAINLYVSDGTTTQQFTAGHDPDYDVGM